MIYDMNKLEGKTLWAQKGGRWVLATLSGIPGNRVAGVFRIDESDLEDWDLWTMKTHGHILTKDEHIPDCHAIWS